MTSYRRHAVYALVPLVLSVIITIVGAVDSLIADTDPTRPNVVLIISDDQSWTDFGFMGHEAIETPRLDRLARESVLFTRGYVPASLCRASLASIISGLYPHEHRITGNDPALPQDARFLRERQELIKNIDRIPSLPRILAEHGYVSFQSGKWWEGNYRRGGFTHGMTHGDPQRDGRHGDEGLKIGREGLEPIYDFIDEADEQPFFIWYAPFLPHRPHTPPARLLNKYQATTASIHIARYRAMCEWFDETCGDLLDFLDNRQLRDNTIVAFVVDNGWIQRRDKSGYAPRSKRSPYEGGLRTPIMIRWPGRLQPKTVDSPVISIDLAPTILRACGVEVPAEMNGIDLRDETAVKNRRAIFGEIFAHNTVDIQRPVSSLQYRWMIEGPWKLIYPHRMNLPLRAPELYDLQNDPHEFHDLARAQATRVAAMTAALNQWWNVAAAEAAPRSQPAAQTTTGRPNILYLMTDDQRNDMLGCAGNSIIQTPNIDGLARRGVRFTNAFVTTAICMTNRACVFSGQYAARHGIHSFKTSFRPEQLAETYPAVLKDHGYRTGFIGKWGVAQPPADLFDYNRGFPGQGYFFANRGDGSPIHLTDLMADQAIEFLQQHDDRTEPFCLSISFKAPHVQDPNRFDLYEPVLRHMYRDVTIPTPPLSSAEFFAQLPEFLRVSENRVRWQARFSTAEKYQESVKSYYRLITGVDMAVGRILDELERLGLADNTVVIFTSDHGFYLGERGFAGKWYAHDLSLRVPLIVRDPRLPSEQQGTTRAEVVLSIDLAPTMLDYADTPAPQRMQGQSIRRLVAGQQVPWRDTFFYEHLFRHERIPRSEAVRTPNWKYIRYLDSLPLYEELYDLQRDPAEADNLANDEGYSETLQQLRAVWADLREQAK